MLYRLGLIFGLFAVCCLPAPAESFELKAMSFNVRLGVADDGDDSWEHRKDIVVDVIREYAPDVIGTQECYDFQAAYIVEQLPHYKWFGVGREADGSGERMAVLYDSRVLSPMRTSNFWLSQTPDVPGTSNWNSACHRMATAAKFYHLPSQQFFRFVNTHLDHRSEDARREGMGVLCARVAEMDDGLPVVVTGDFNCPAGEADAWKTAKAVGFRDAWNIAGEQIGPTLTFNGFRTPEREEGRRIDWILVSAGVDVSRCETVTYNKDGRYPSDHFPIFAKMTLKPWAR